MSHQVLGGGGIDVDMVSGRPKDPQVKNAEAQARYHDAVTKSLELLAELQNGSPGFRIAVQQAYDRLAALAKEDPIFQTNLNIILAYRHEVEIAPRLALELLRRFAGPQLSQFVGVEEQEEAAASEEIPAE
jgi:hypothetical protein